MADHTDIDALVLAARAAARDLNEILEKLEVARVKVSVVDLSDRELGRVITTNRVELGIVFPCKSPYASTPPQRPITAIEQDMMKRYAQQLAQNVETKRR